MNEMQNAITGQRIKEARKKCNLSQRELADMLGKSLRTIQKYESGEIEVNNLTIQMLAIALNVTPFYLSGYSADSIHLESLGDVCAFFFELENKAMWTSTGKRTMLPRLSPSSPGFPLKRENSARPT